MKLLRTVDDVRRALEPIRRTNSIALVPTMGALHEGHLSLFRAARRDTEAVVASIFVNPAQFGEKRDLDAYPRNESADLALAESAGVQYVFAPSANEIYPPGFATWVSPEGAALGLEGDFRKGHFRGVATVCLKLFNIVQPTWAYFGQKDAQQVAVIQQMVRDLNLPLEIRVCPTVRDRDGLALSSRNARLSPDERRRALAIPRSLAAGLEAFRRGDDPVEATRQELAGLQSEYVEIADLMGRSVLAVAARIGATRLIDNVPLDGSVSAAQLIPEVASHVE